jgi:CheY-like chemotaxis protein
MGSDDIGKVLVVDDRADFRRLVAEFLKPANGTICECADPDKIIETYEREKPNWVLMDVHLRNADGLKETAKLLSAFPKARVVVASAYSMAEIEEPAAKAGALACVSKDDLSQLAPLLRKLRG